MNLDLEHELNSHLMQLQDVLHDPKPPHESVQDPEAAAAAALDFELMQDLHNSDNWEYHQNHHHNMSTNNQDYFVGNPSSLSSQQIDLQCFNSSATPTPDLLNLFHLPRYSLLPNSSISFSNPKPGNFDFFPGNEIYDSSSLHLDLPPQQTPIFKELFHSLPYGSRTVGVGVGGGGVGVGVGGGSSSFFDEHGNGVEGRQFENTVLEFGREMGKGEDHVKGRQHFATERQRREQLNSKYKDLRQLVPNPTKGDRASIVHDAIEYIKELLRTVDELKILVDKKRYGREKSKKLKTEDEEAAGDVESSSMKPISTLTEREQSNGTRASWLRRKSKETEVDVRIIEDEVTIKLIQRKKMNCLLSVSKILDELQLDLLHVSGGNIGETYCFLFNTKIYEGSSVYARAIANKLIEAVDKNYSAFQPGSF